IYNSEEDIRFFTESLKEIIRKKDEFISKYEINSLGDYEHKDFKFTSDEYFCITSWIDNELKIDTQSVR
ncbi:MAG: hypothetical protein ACE5D7_01245, partial [Fidelibacterota bacterium]